MKLHGNAAVSLRARQRMVDQVLGRPLSVSQFAGVAGSLKARRAGCTTAPMSAWSSC
jgi:hypothetical protein